MTPVAQFTEAEVQLATQSAGTTVLKPRRAPRAVARVKQSRGYAKGTSGFAVGYPVKVFA